MPTKLSAYQFGHAVGEKLAWSDFKPGGYYGFTKGLGIGGAALGAGLGGIVGAVNPGETGDGKNKKPRSTLYAALRGAGLGGLIGGGVGAGSGLAADAFTEPNPIETAINMLPGVRLEGGEAVEKRVEDAANAAKQKWDETRKSWGF